MEIGKFPITSINHKAMKNIISTIILILISLPGSAQFRLSAEYRPRTEYSHGYATLASEGQKPSLFTSQRTRLNADYQATGIQTRLVMQDVRLWGNQAQQNTNEDFAISIHEAWAEAVLGKGISLRLGRQELVYDNSRIFGNVGWAQQARSHDLALLKFSGFVEAHLGVAYHESGNRKNNYYTGPDAYKFLQFIWLNKSFGALKVSLLGVNNGVPLNTVNPQGEIISQKIRFTQTFGPYVEYKAGKLSFSGNAYYQMGELVNGKSVKAYEYLLEAGWAPVKDLSFGAGYEELSGTDAIKSATHANSFSPLYTTGHKFNGHMDYFYAGNHGGSVGLRNLYFKAGYQLKGISLGLDLHKFWAQADFAENQDHSLATEFDFYTGYKINESIELNIGYSHLLPDESMVILKGGSTEAVQNWGWVMFTFKPVFLK
jgi:hypothetical protein